MVALLKEAEEVEEFKMKIKKLNEDKKTGKLSLLIEGTDEVFANTIRRMIIEEVPVLAVEDVEIRENNSALYDEMLALRLGLTPIKTDYSSYNLPEECKCGGAGCAQCQLKIELKSDKPGVVYAKDAKSTDPKCTFVYPKMPFVKLIKDQKIDLTMTAVMGKGKVHTKWTPALVYYKNEPKLTIGNVKDPQAIMEKCTDGVLVLKGNKITVDESKIYTTQLAEFYAELDENIKLEYTGNIIFFMESWGQLGCKEILNKSVDLFLDKIKEMEGLI
jgi:DNA-directed RNA polymerase subunit D